jgi:hypothetical protein
VADWRKQPGMLGMRFTFHNEHYRHLLTDGSADWVWPAAEKACGIGSWGRPASESGRLRHGDGEPEGGNRCRRGLVLTILYPLAQKGGGPTISQPWRSATCVNSRSSTDPIGRCTNSSNSFPALAGV